MIGLVSLQEESKNSCETFTSAKMCCSLFYAMTACVSAISAPASGSTHSCASIAAEMVFISTQAAFLLTLMSKKVDLRRRKSGSQSFWDLQRSLSTVGVARLPYTCAEKARMTRLSRSGRWKDLVSSADVSNSAAVSSFSSPTINLLRKLITILSR